MNELLEKYWEGTTSHEEEQRLKRYFASSSVSAEHEVYKPLFATLHMESQEDVSFDAFAKVNKKGLFLRKLDNHKWKSLAVAAGLAALMTTGLIYQDSIAPEPDLGTYDNPEEAYEATVNALQFMGTKINAGKAKLEPLQTLEVKKNEVFKRDVLENAVDSLKNESEKQKQKQK